MIRKNTTDSDIQEIRNDMKITFANFLNVNYPCQCGEIEDCDGESNEALEMVDMMLNRIKADFTLIPRAS